ncbi:MAG: type I methionyl aminopeptidase [Candidatus Omnitrophota bacterium]|nr:type I methionyl aminopeptidase [Candidatus Omnitrophota bacterium]MBU1895076.1 type I methionyl aminopeptidase [Candidatus Omnitrophota bacterium]
MTILTNEKDIRKIRESGEILKKVFSFVENKIMGGVSTLDLDIEVEKEIRRHGAEPAFKGYKGYPGSICASLNEVVVHGIPSADIVIQDGDIVSIDIGVKKNGYFTDAARTFSVGTITEEAERLIDCTKQCLTEGIKQAVTGNRVSDISHAIQNVAEKFKFKEVRMFVGHGVGKALHEPPEVPNWGQKGKGPVLQQGLVLAIEPMINCGTRNVKIKPDGWTAVTADGKFSAHFEDTVIVGNKEAEIIT